MTAAFTEESMTQSQSEPAGSPEERPHRPADDREEVYFEGSPQLRGELRNVLLWGFIGAVLIGVGVYLFIIGLWPATIALVVLGVLTWALPLLLVRSIRYRITNYRIDYERGLLARRIDTLELWHVEDIAFAQTLSDRILGVGKIKIISHDDTTPLLLLRGLPRPRQIFDSLKQRIIAVKRQRGVIKMDIGG
jgi:hypothetical protein